MEKPIFTYWENGADAFVRGECICDCCRNIIDEYHISNSKWWCGWKEYCAKNKLAGSEIGIQGRDDYELHLCHDCIASGAAAKKFHLKFNWVVNPSDENPAIGGDEVETRTPSYRRVNKDSWPVHCGEACVYIEGYAVDMYCVCHDFRCRRCNETISVKEHTDRLLCE